MKNRRAFYIALVIALVGAVLVKLALDSERKRLSQEYELVDIVVATQDIRRFEIIEKEMLGIRKIPKPFIQPLAVQAGEEGKIIGFNMADATIKKGEQIIRTKLALIGEGGISPVIPKGMRACTVSINDVTGVGGLIRNRDHVDVVATVRVIDKATRIPTNVEAVTLFQNVPVLSVGRNYIFDRPAEAAQNAGKSGLLGGGRGQSLQFSNLTLLLSPRECMDLSVAQQIGELSLNLRSYHDRFGGQVEKSLKDKPSTPSSVTGIKEPVQVSQKPRWLEIRGTDSQYVP